GGYCPLHSKIGCESNREVLQVTRRLAGRDSAVYDERHLSAVYGAQTAVGRLTATISSDFFLLTRRIFRVMSSRSDRTRIRTSLGARIVPGVMYCQLQKVIRRRPWSQI